MQRISYTMLLILVTLTSCSGGGQYSEMRQRLVALNELNRADSVLTVKERDEAQTLTDYFDSHGTPNDQLLAITHADTTSKDCDFAQLSRVYGQSASIFYQQGLYRNQLEYENLASNYAWRGNDILASLTNFAKQASAYDQLQMKDSAILIYTDAIRQMKAHKYDKMHLRR